jgi:hypothetical protein
MFSVLFIFIMDATLKDLLEREGKNYEKFNKYIELVQLWAVPLIVMGVITTISLIIVTFGLV